MPLRTRLVTGVTALLLAAVGLGGPASGALSDYYLAAGSGTNVFSVRYTGTMNATWRGYLQSGVSAWNSTYSSTGTVISTTSGSTNKSLRLGSLPSGTIGQYQYGGTRANRTFVITVDANRIIDSPQRVASIAAWARFTTMHELGHALSLKDNPSTSSASIMTYKPMSWTGVYASPRPYDTSAVASIY